MAQVVLQLKALGVDNILRFDFLTAPPAQMMIRALEVMLGDGIMHLNSEILLFVLRMISDKTIHFSYSYFIL